MDNNLNRLFIKKYMVFLPEHVAENNFRSYLTQLFFLLWRKGFLPWLKAEWGLWLPRTGLFPLYMVVEMQLPQPAPIYCRCASPWLLKCSEMYLFYIRCHHTQKCPEYPAPLPRDGTVEVPFKSQISLWDHWT